MIQLHGVSKQYKTGGLFKEKKQVEAVKNLNLEIEPGGFGLLGVNGAGKTTTIKMMATLLHPSQGNIAIDGLDAVKQVKLVRTKVNMITGSDRMLYYRLTARENLRYFGALYGLGGTELSKRIDELLEFVNLRNAADERVERFSRGMKQRLSIARGLVNDPLYLFLDEPTLGLDVAIAREIRSFIRERLLSDAKRTVVLTSHYMKEVEELCPTIAILNNGCKIYHGETRSLGHSLGLHPTHSFTFPVGSTQLRAKINKLFSAADTAEELPDRLLRIQIHNAENVASRIIADLNSLGIREIQYQHQKPGLEDALLKLSGQ